MPTLAGADREALRGRRAAIGDQHRRAEARADRGPGRRDLRDEGRAADRRVGDRAVAVAGDEDGVADEGGDEPIVGAATHGIGLSPGRSATDLAAGASLAALASAGLTLADVDGIFVGLSDEFLSGLSFPEYLT